MKSFAILALLASCSLGIAQTDADIKLPAGVRMYEPKNLTPDKAQSVAASVRGLMMDNGMVGWDNVMHAFVIRSGNPAGIDMAEALLKRYDVPDPRVELTVSLIRASLPSAAPVAGLLGNPVPADLKAAIDEMKGAFNYDRYTLWDTVLLLPRGGGSEVQGILPADGGSKNYVYRVSYANGNSPPVEGKTVNLLNFEVSIRMPQLKEDIESHIRTNITIHEGQKLVLGKIRLLPNANADLFLVLTTKVY